MRLNPDCVRDILITLEKQLIPDSDGFIEPIDPDDLKLCEPLSFYPSGTVLRHIDLMMDADLLEAASDVYVDDKRRKIAEISPDGYIFLDQAREKAFWEKLKENPGFQIASASIPLLLQLIQTIASL